MRISAVDLVLRVAAKSEGASEIPANTNAGPYVERVLRRVGHKKGAPWCAADIADTGAIALGMQWPLPLTASCPRLYEFAKRHGLLEETPARGDVFLVWDPVLGRFAHTGFVIDVNTDGTCDVHDGNTSGGGSREGWIVAEHPRRFKPADRFIRWARLVNEDAAA